MLRLRTDGLDPALGADVEQGAQGVLDAGADDRSLPGCGSGLPSRPNPRGVDTTRFAHRHQGGTVLALSSGCAMTSRSGGRQERG